MDRGGGTSSYFVYKCFLNKDQKSKQEGVSVCKRLFCGRKIFMEGDCTPVLTELRLF